MDNDYAKYFINLITSITALSIYHIVSTSLNRTALRLIEDHTREVKDYLDLRNKYSNLNLDLDHLQPATVAVSKIKEIYNEEQLIFPNFDYFRVRRKLKKLTDLLEQV